MTAVPLFVSQQDSLRDLEGHFTEAVDRARRSGRPLVVSVSAGAERSDPVGVFEAARVRGEDAVFWHVPWQGVVLVGLGSVWTVTAEGPGRFDEVSRRWRELLAGAVHVVDEGLRAADGGLETDGRREMDLDLEAEVDAGRRAGFRQGSGVAARVDFETAFRPNMGPGPGPILLGGFAFDAGSATGPWTSFGDARLALARLTYGEAAGRVWTTVNTVVDAETDPRAAAEAVLRDQERSVASVPPPGPSRSGRATPGAAPSVATGSAEAAASAEAVASWEDVQPKDSWLAAVEEVSAAICDGLLDKAVLARSARLTAPAGFNLGASLRYLQAHYPECYVFAVGRDDQCFLGATPERIVHKRDGHVQVACMAGSIARGATPAEDEWLGQQLLNDAKNMAEHRIVLHSILEALTPVCTDVAAPERTGLRKLANVQHLYTPVTARVQDDTDVLALVSRVHPTPAIGGWPTDKALALIREKEGLDRGWYAGPIGWMDGRGDGEFAVGLRSALVQGETALLFAGCGIMGDSVPESEYEESVLKLRPMRAALEAGR